MPEYDKFDDFSREDELELKRELVARLHKQHMKSFAKAILLFCICLGLAVFNGYRIFVLEEASDYWAYAAFFIALVAVVHFGHLVVEGYRIVKRLDRIAKQIMEAEAESSSGQA